MQPFSLLIKPAGPDCNMACPYCFYARKTELFGSGKHRMTNEVLERLISDYMKLRFPVSSFAWQGGEPTLMGLDFYKKVVELQKGFGLPGQVISNALQTNAILLDENWCKFLSKFNWLVGISLDGPARLHNHYRLDRASRSTFDRVRLALENCRKHKVQFNILVLLNDKNVTCAHELFDFFMSLKIKYLQFIPCVERDPGTGKVASFSITPTQYGDFLCKIFDRWCDWGPGKVSIRMFDSILAYLLHRKHTICTFGPKCSDYIVIEHNGDAFCCDFFVDEEYRLGNILETTIDRLAQGERKRSFARRKSNISNNCLICEYNTICRGGCLKDRVVINDDFTNISYFCPAYKQFFDYTLPRFAQIAAKIAQR